MATKAKKEKPGTNASSSAGNAGLADPTLELKQQNQLLLVSNEQLRQTVDGYREQLEQLYIKQLVFIE